MEVGHRFECRLSRGAREEASNLLAVPFDYDFLALDRQSVLDSPDKRGQAGAICIRPFAASV